MLLAENRREVWVERCLVGEEKKKEGHGSLWLALREGTGLGSAEILWLVGAEER